MDRSSNLGRKKPEPYRMRNSGFWSYCPRIIAAKNLARSITGFKCSFRLIVAVWYYFTRSLSGALFCTQERRLWYSALKRYTRLDPFVHAIKIVFCVIKHRKGSILLKLGLLDVPCGLTAHLTGFGSRDFIICENAAFDIFFT